MAWLLILGLLLQLYSTYNSNFLIGYRVLDDKVDSPTDNKMQNIWNSHVSEPKEKTVPII